VADSLAHQTVRYRVGIDIGGTFTDFSLIDNIEGRLYSGKCLTTPANPELGVIEGLSVFLKECGIDPAELHAVVHATTLVSNCLIERKGAVTGLLTTDGFADIVEIGRELRYDLYDLFLRFPKPLAARNLRLGVRERIAASGEIITPLDEGDLIAKANQLICTEGVESLAICFLHSFRNPAHEERAKSILEALFPNFPISISADVGREIREVERTSTTLANAYVKPIVSRYLEKLSQGFRNLGVKPEIFIMLSNAGFSNLETARKYPIQLVESGPAAGVQVAAYFAKQLRKDRIIAFDMGGTTAKAGLVRDGKPIITYESEVAREHRFKKGSGIPLQVPTIDLIEAGAGGGSIAQLDRLGLLKVGPESASSDPGPACYGLGGTLPTVTDADLVLGYLDPNYFLGGRMKLDIEASRKVILKEIGTPLGMSEIEAAWGIHDLVNENMSAFIRTYLAERGEDPRRFSLVCTGGAGPVHAFQVAQKLHMSQLICPLGAGVASSLGLLTSPPLLERVISKWVRLDNVDWNDINNLYSDMETSIVRVLARFVDSKSELQTTRSAEVRFIGQGYQMLVNVPDGPLSAKSGDIIASNFDTAFKSRYGRLPMRAVGREILSWRISVSGRIPDLELRHVTPKAGTSAIKGHRTAYFGRRFGMLDTPVYDRYSLVSGTRFDGPALVEERESTVVIAPRSYVEVCDRGELMITLEALT